MSGKNPQLCPFSGLFLPFLGYTARTPLFSRKSPARSFFNIAAGLKAGRSVTFLKRGSNTGIFLWIHVFDINSFYEKMGLKNPNRRKSPALNACTLHLQFLKTLIFPRALWKLQNGVNFSIISYLKFFCDFLKQV